MFSLFGCIRLESHLFFLLSTLSDFITLESACTKHRVDQLTRKLIAPRFEYALGGLQKIGIGCFFGLKEKKKSKEVDEIV